MSNLKGDSGGLLGPKSDENIYEDDGFFSDVPATGSLSKSLRALNKYMKTNLLYEDTEEVERESDYFSKESSPNESVSKCDSESLISNESSENNFLPVSVNTTEMSNTSSSKALPINSKSNSENNIPNANTVNKTTKDPRVAGNSDDRRKPMYQSAVNLTDDQITQNKEAAIRQKTNNDVKNSAHRHTVHEFNNWGNRTNTYPDVYAPLPYKSPRRYVENEVNIHYRCPVRRDPLPLLPERELARQQSEHMKRVYRDQRRAKYLQDLEIEPSDVDAFDASIKELQDMQARRHQDNFTPAQKSILPLDRYEAPARGQGAARALYAFSGQTPRELTFRKGELIAVRRQVDDNWYEGELHGKVGLFPYNYVEMVKGDALQSSAKSSPTEGRARAKFEFVAQTSLELPLKKGELVALSRRIDQNWWEGRVGSRTGIFPDSYVQVLQEPGDPKPVAESIVPNNEKPVSSPAAHGLLSGGARRSMGAHSYMPHLNSPALSGPPATMPLPGYTAKPVKSSVTPSERGYGPPSGPGVDLNNTEPLYVDTNAEAVPYRAMYKYRPQNPDELELAEGDTVYVLEQCDDGWYVGSSQRTGRFGTFPGNYVERI